MANILNMQNAMLSGEAKFNRMLAKIETKYNEPMMDAALSKYWQSLDPTMREELRAANPKAFADTEKRFGKKEGA